MTDEVERAAIVTAKRLLRGAVRLRRESRPKDQCEHLDEQRFRLLRELLVARSPGRVAAYLSTGTEPDSLRLVAWLMTHGLEVLLPLLSDGSGSWLPEPTWARYEGPDHLREGRSGILEPTGLPLSADALATVDVMVVPGLAADVHGSRLGRGGGWYDRARSRVPDLETWLLLNDDEILDVVPTDTWDLPVHLVVTPSRVITAV